MPEPLLREEERRRDPRFICAGEAGLVCLPSDGRFLPGMIHDLSLGGCSIELSQPLGTGSRTEMLVRMSEASFRAVGVVKAAREGSVVGIEFVRLSAGGRELLSDVIREMARLRAIIHKLQASNQSTTAKAFREQLEVARIQKVMLETKFPFLKTAIGEDSVASEESSALQVEEAKLNPAPRIIRVSLFG